MASFTKAPDEVQVLVEECLHKYRPDLQEVGVTVGTRFAHAARDKETGEPKGPALKHGGYGAWAIIRVTQQKDRVLGLPDLIIDFDADIWEELSQASRVALIDHELMHPELVRDEEGNPILDDCHRPRIKMRLHDYQIGGFWAVVDRHGVDACEALAYEQLRPQFQSRMKQV